MAAIPTRYSVGNQAQRIADAFSSQNFAGGVGLPNTPGIAGLGAWWEDLIKAGTGIVQSRFGTPPGMVIQRTPQGEIIYRQPEGSTTTLPIIPGPLSTQQYGVSGPEGFSTGMAIALGVGVLALVLVMRGGRK